MLLDEEQNELILHAAKGFGPAYHNQPPLKIGEGIAGRTAEIGHPIVVEDVLEETTYRYPNIAREEHLCSLLYLYLHRRQFPVLSSPSWISLQCHLDK